jgi:hypothetical protein
MSRRRLTPRLKLIAGAVFVDSRPGFAGQVSRGARPGYLIRGLDRNNTE